jgi:hypothetical protein
MDMVWQWGVPIIAFSMYFTLFRLKDGKELYERKWLPLAISSCWVAVSLINFGSVNFVYSVPFQKEYVGLILFIVFHIVRLMYLNKGSAIDGVLLWVSTLCPLILRNELPIHFTIMLSINIVLLVPSLKAHRSLILWNGICLLLHISFLVTETGSNYRLVILGAFFLAGVYSFVERSYEKSVLLAVLYILVSKELTGEISFLTYFEALSIPLLNIFFWKVEEVIKHNLFISCLAVLWLAVAILIQMGGGAYGTIIVAGILAVVLVGRVFVLKYYLPKLCMYCVVAAMGSSFCIEYIGLMSRSLLIVSVSFAVFGLGVYMSIKQAKIPRH